MRSMTLLWKRRLIQSKGCSKGICVACLIRNCNSESSTRVRWVSEREEAVLEVQFVWHLEFLDLQMSQVWQLA
jgi:hypothetical protein